MRVPVLNRIYRGWGRLHPFDRDHGIDTGGLWSGERIRSGKAADAHQHAYLGSQPSVIRRALAAIPDHQSYAFVDIGCGKGRPLIVASEFPFRDILGVELSPALAHIASANAERISHHHPERTKIRVVEGDALECDLPAGNLIFFLYHSFDREATLQLSHRISRLLEAEPRRFYLIYNNPVLGDIFDNNPMLKRHYAEMLRYAPEEVGYGTDLDDTVVTWTTADCSDETVAGHNRKILVINPWRVELAPVKLPAN
jgi:SAM-dependent methyltransferase